MIPKFKITLLCGLLALASGACRAESPAFPGYTLVWADEFDGTELDRSVWNVEVNGSGCGNNELEYYIDSPENVAVRDGKLVLTARRQEHDGKAFTSGRINSQGKFAFLYGILEASIRLPRTDGGLWPAFWAMGNDIREVGWPRCGETDILEMGHADGMKEQIPDRLFNGALHWGPDAASHQQSVGVSRHRPTLQDGEFHTLRLVWTPEQIAMYADSDPEPYLVHDISDPQGVGAYFNKHNFILFNLAVGGDFPGIHDPAQITALNDDNGHSASMEVDYVRLYQKEEMISGAGTVDNGKSKLADDDTDTPVSAFASND